MPIPGISCMGAAGADASISLDLSYVTATSSSTNASSYTFNSISIGAEPSSGRVRYIVICVGSADGSATASPTCTVNVNGSAASKAVEIADYFSINSAYAGIFYYQLNSGTVANFELSFNQSMEKAGIKIYRLTSSATGISVASTYTDTVNNLNSFSISGSSGDCIVGCAMALNGGPFSLSYLTEDSDTDIESNDYFVSGSKSLISNISSQSEHFDTLSDAGDYEAGVIAVFEPL